MPKIKNILKNVSRERKWLSELTICKWASDLGEDTAQQKRMSYSLQTVNLIININFVWNIYKPNPNFAVQSRKR